MRKMHKNKKAWVVAVNMGYGHQRTAHPLRKLALEGEIINANDYQGIPEKDKKIWESTRGFYEFISRFKRIPLMGKIIFSIFDKFQQIPAFYPYRDLSKPSFNVRNIFSLIKKGWGRDLVERLKSKGAKPPASAGSLAPLSLITTFFTPAFMAEFFNYPGGIFCVVCDADVSRAWAPLNPQKSKIKYFAPDSWVVNRLKLYGVKKENIFLTGYPLPIENIGTEKMEVLKKDLSYRLLNLDPKKEYFKNYKILVEGNLGKLPRKKNHPLTVMFSIGGAGVQKEIGNKIITSLAPKIRAGEVKVILAAGIRQEVKEYFEENIKMLGLKGSGGVEVLFAKSIPDYFEKFNQQLHTTDALWTKPSELSFYTGLGLPIIVAPPVGSQEDFNKKWLLSLGSGTLQENPKYTHQWFFDYLESGRLAEAAMQGFIEAEKLGTYNIEKIVFRN